MNDICSKCNRSGRTADNKREGKTMDDHGKEYYGREYYQSYCGGEYDRGHGWEEIFSAYAERIQKEIHPRKTLDVGCAKGFFVEALRDRGIEAYGFDISDYAVSQVREDIRPYCRTYSAVLPIQERYDLITCIEVLEHLDNTDIPAAVMHMCESSDDILFSSTPFDYEEESHVSVHPPGFWAQQFAYNGFYHDVQYDCSYISVQAMRFRRAAKNSIDLIREYEDALFQKHQAWTAVRQRCRILQENVKIYQDAYQEHVDMINQELNPKILELEQKLAVKEEEVRKETELNCRSQIEKIEVNCCSRMKKMEENCRLRMEEEIEGRKHFEEMYYICMEELQEAREAASGKMKYMESFMKISKWKAVKRKCKKKCQELRLLHKKNTYWEPVFDAQYYAKQNKDIAEVFGMDEKSLLKHFIYYGMYEGRAAKEGLDMEEYVRYTPELANRWKEDRRACYMHYIADKKKKAEG